MPFNSSASILLYNKDAFKEVGLDPEKAPKSYKELAEAAKKLTKGTERYGFAMIMDAWFIEQLLANENTLYVNEENGRAGKSPTAVAYNGEKIKTIFNWLMICTVIIQLLRMEKSIKILEQHFYQEKLVCI